MKNWNELATAEEKIEQLGKLIVILFVMCGGLMLVDVLLIVTVIQPTPWPCLPRSPRWRERTWLVPGWSA